MSDFVTVWSSSGTALMLFHDAAKVLGHNHGDRLSNSQIWEALTLNASAGIAKCQAEMAKIESPRADFAPRPDDVGQSDG